jgi:hypothetical protein
MSQSQPLRPARRQADHERQSRHSATTAEGVAAERALLTRRRGTEHATDAARRLERAARADRRVA